MSLETGVVLLAVGLLAGWLSGAVMKVGSHGLKVDLVLGAGGSLAGAASLYGVSRTPDAGWLPLLIGSVVGAGLLLVLQRMFWEPPALPTRRKR